MNESSKKKFTPNQAANCVNELRIRYRRCLLALGRSPDTHIYDLGHDFLAYARKCPERTFLIRVKSYYEGLRPKDQRLFIAEVLEKGRQYQFWYLSEYKECHFRNHQRKLYNKVASDFDPMVPAEV